CSASCCILTSGFFVLHSDFCIVSSSFLLRIHYLKMPEKKPFIFPKKPRGCCCGGGGGSTVAGIGVGVRGDARAMASLFRRGVGSGCSSLARKTSGASTCTCTSA